MGVDRLLDHLRIDVEAAGDDHVLLAVDEIEIAVVVHVADVAGEEAVADECFGGFLRPVPVALGDVRALDADFADLAGAAALASGSSSATTSISMPGSISPIEPGLSGPSGGCAGAGRAGLGHAPAALQLHADLALEDPARPRPAAARRRSRSSPATTGRACPCRACCNRDPHGRHAGKCGGALDLDVAHHGLDVEALVQRDQIAAPERATAAPRSARRYGTAAARRSRARRPRARRARGLPQTS